MKMNRNLLLIASVFFVLLLTGCGIASIFYVETRISPFQESVPSTHTFRVTISDTKIPPNLDLIANGDGPTLFLGYVVTNQQVIDPNGIIDEFNKKYRRSPFGINLSSDYRTGPILETTILKLFVFSGTSLSTRQYHAVANTTNNVDEDFSVTIESHGDEGFTFKLKSLNGHYAINIPGDPLTRFNGEKFTITEIGNLNYIDYIVEEGEIDPSRYCHFFAAINAGEGAFNNIYWSDLNYLGSIQIEEN